MNRKVRIAVIRLMRKTPMDPATIEKICSVRKGITISDISDMAYGEHQGDLSRKHEMDAVLSKAEILYGFPPPRDLMSRAPRLKWIQTPIAGVEPFLIPEVIKSPVLLTNAHGIHATQMAELTLAHMLMLAKKAPEFWPAKEDRRWIEGLIPDLLHSKTALILGYGSIGQEIGRLAKAFRMRVIAMRAHTDQPTKYADAVFGTEKLKELLSQSDYVVNVLPLTTQTRGIIGAAELRAMKPTAYLINVGRGATIDEQALIRALKEKWIAGAGLDVYTQRPLAATSELWRLPNVAMTPHCGGQRPDYDILATDLFYKNLRRYLSGKPLINLVDKKRGY